MHSTRAQLGSMALGLVAGAAVGVLLLAARTVIERRETATITTLDLPCGKKLAVTPEVEPDGRAVYALRPANPGEPFTRVEIRSHREIVYLLEQPCL